MKDITQIVVPVDLAEHTEKIIAYAAAGAEKFSAKLHVVHVVELLPTLGELELGTTTMDSFNKKRMEQSKDFLHKFLLGYPECTGKIVSGVIVDEITSYAKSVEADLIIIGTHGTKGLEKLLLGSVAERVVKNAHCPTLVMNPYKQAAG